MSEDSNNLEPFLPALDLRNKPDGGKGPLGKEDFCLKDPELVKNLQKMLKTLGYDIGKSGIDGKFGSDTEKAVTNFQKKNKDWDGKQLKDDGLVGPKTSDALNRAMVGKSYEGKKWDDHYQTHQTPKELVEDKPIWTVTSDFLAKGLEIEPGEAKKARVFLVGLFLTIRLIKDINTPLQKAKYSLDVGNKHFEGATTDDGILSHPIPHKAKKGKLKLDTVTFDLIIEDIGPVGTVEGAEVRLKNLGFFPSDLDEVKSPGQAEKGKENNQEREHLRMALIRFQKALGIGATGELDGATKQQLEEAYGG